MFACSFCSCLLHSHFPLDLTQLNGAQGTTKRAFLSRTGAHYIYSLGLLPTQSPFACWKDALPMYLCIARVYTMILGYLQWVACWTLTLDNSIQSLCFFQVILSSCRHRGVHLGMTGQYRIFFKCPQGKAQFEIAQRTFFVLQNSWMWKNHLLFTQEVPNNRS